MIVTSASDYREAARRRLPRFLFDYIDGGANVEQTMRANIADLIDVSLRQRVLKNVSDLSLEHNPIKLHHNRMRRSSSCTLAA